MTVLVSVSCHFHHGGPQEAVFELVAALQLLEHLVISGLVGVDHLDRFMLMGIEELPLGCDRSQTQLRQRVLQLSIDEFDASAELGFFRRGLQGALKAVQNREQRANGVGHRILTEVLLFAGGPLARVFEFGLQAGQAVE